MGTAVAVSGDVIVVGAPGEDRGDKGGACHVYRRVSGTWTEEAVLHPSAYGPGSDYGTTVAVRGDVIAVGAWTAQSIPDGGNYGRGAAFVYRHSASGWAEEATLTVPGGGLFGRAVALADDLVAVGAPYENDGSGAVYVYRHTGDAWNVEAHVTPGATAMADTQLGMALALTDDRLVVGAAFENSQLGSVYTFARAGAVWSFEQRFLAPSNPDGRQVRFGYSVAIDGDTIAVGAPFDPSDSAGIDGDAAAPPLGYASGGVHLYGHVGGVWTPQAYVKPANPQLGAQFGYAVALAKETVVVGAVHERSGSTGIDSTPTTEGNEIGAAYVFRRKNGTWSQRAYVKAPIVHNRDWFGASVATDGTTLVVGVPYEQSEMPGITIDPDASAPGGSVSGAAYVY